MAGQVNPAVFSDIINAQFDCKHGGGFSAPFQHWKGAVTQEKMLCHLFICAPVATGLLQLQNVKGCTCHYRQGITLVP